MKTFKLLTIVLLVLSFSISSYSQIGFTFNLMGALPMSEYGSDDLEEDGSGGAGMGFGLGVQYVYPLMSNGLGLFVGADAIYAGFKKSMKEDFEDLFESQFETEIDFTWPKIFNVPISAGLNFTFGASESMGVFVNAGLAYNIFKMTDIVLEVDEGKVTMETDLATHLGFKIGGGLILNERMSVFVNYLGLGEHELEQTVKYTGGEPDDMKSKQKIDILTFGIGLRF